MISDEDRLMVDCPIDWSTDLLIFCLSMILTATLCPVRSWVAIFTFAKLPWPRVVPRLYLGVGGASKEHTPTTRHLFQYNDEISKHTFVHVPTALEKVHAYTGTSRDLPT